MNQNSKTWRWIGAILAAAAVVALLPAIVTAQAIPPQTTLFSGVLTGANEVPANASTATGEFTATLDEAAGTLTWSLSVPSITNATAAHLHAGAAGVNGGIVLPLFAAPTNAPAASVNVSGTARAADLTGMYAGNFAGFVAALKAGTIYANVHTTAFAPGEIRTQLVMPAASTPAPTTTAPAPAKSGNAGLIGTTQANGAEVPLLLVLTAAVVAGARVVTRGARR